MKMNSDIAPERKGKLTLVIELDLCDDVLIEPGTPVCAYTWFDGAGMVHALSGEIISAKIVQSEDE